MKLFTLLVVGVVFAGGVITGVFLAESETLTGEDLRRFRKYAVDRFSAKPVE